jgi:hypothetical protein
MKRLALTLALALAFFNCTPEDECGEVTGWDISNNGNYLVWIDGHKHVVNAGTWYEANIGDYMCIEY